MEIKRIDADFYEANVYIISENNKAIIIDSGANLNKIKEVIGEMQVLAVLLTHAHFDHAFFCKEYANEYHCPIFMQNSGTLTLLNPERNYGETFAISNFDEFKLFESDFHLTLAPFEIDVLCTCGHSSESVCYLINGNLFAGDTLFSNGIGRTDLIGSDKQKMIESLEKLANVPFDKVYSGHGEASDQARQKRNITLFVKFLKR